MPNGGRSALDFFWKLVNSIIFFVNLQLITLVNNSFTLCMLFQIIKFIFSQFTPVWFLIVNSLLVQRPYKRLVSNLQLILLLKLLKFLHRTVYKIMNFIISIYYQRINETCRFNRITFCFNWKWEWFLIWNISALRRFKY